MTNRYLIPGLTAAPLVYDRLMATILTTRHDDHLDPDRFSPREVIAHIADWEPIMLQRMKDGVANSGCAILVYDEGQMAIDHQYSKRDVREELSKFSRDRAMTVEFLAMLTPEQWASTVIHPERGPQTTYDQANTMLGHDIYHFEQLTQFFGEKTAGTW